jgi:hypothetical protein
MRADGLDGGPVLRLGIGIDAGGKLPPPLPQRRIHLGDNGFGRATMRVVGDADAGAVDDHAPRVERLVLRWHPPGEVPEAITLVGTGRRRCAGHPGSDSPAC